VDFCILSQFIGTWLIFVFLAGIRNFIVIEATTKYSGFIELIRPSINPTPSITLFPIPVHKLA
jgi:hypothetical protein